MLEKGASVNGTDNDKQTALHWACVRGSLPCAELLLRSNAKLDHVDVRGGGGVQARPTSTHRPESAWFQNFNLNEEKLAFNLNPGF